MRAGDIALIPGQGVFGGRPAMVLPKTGEIAEVWTGQRVLTYYRSQLLPHGRVRRVRTYRTRKGKEFAQFNVNFGEEDYVVDVEVTDLQYKTEDLRKAAFLKALGRRAEEGFRA